MKSCILNGAIAMAMACTASVGISAEVEAAPPTAPVHLAVGAGMFDVNDDDKAANFNLEWRSAPFWWNVRPMVGAQATTDASLYGYAGIAIDLFLGDRFVVTPSFAPGLYFEGDGKDLGHVVEFRSGIELSYRFDNDARLGLGLHHLSNAGLDERNPGVETLTLFYQMPLAGLFN